MRIAVIGAGAVGCYFGGRLAAAGSEVWFRSRGAQAEALRSRGLTLATPEGETRLERPQVFGADEAPGAFDVLLLTVKMYDLATVAAGLGRLLHRESAVVPLQNGVEAVDLLRPHVDSAHLCGGLAKIGASLVRPGVVERVGSMAQLVFGELDGRLSPRLKAFEETCRSAGIDAACVPDIERQLWEKFVFLTPFAAVTARSRRSIGPVREDPALWRDLRAMLEEAAAVGRASGVSLPADLPERIAAFIEGLPRAMRSSLLDDLEAGRRLELDWLTGAVLRLGARHGVPTPVTAAYHRALTPLAAGSPRSAPAAGRP